MFLIFLAYSFVCAFYAFLMHLINKQAHPDFNMKQKIGDFLFNYFLAPISLIIATYHVHRGDWKFTEVKK